MVAGLISSNRIRGIWNRPKLRLIALTEFAKQKMVQGKIAAEKISIKPNFLDPDPGFTPKADQHALFVGRLSEEKGIGILLEAWEQLGMEIPLVVAGDGTFRSLVEEGQEKSGRIVYVGRKRQDEIFDIYRSAAVLIIPSLCYEGLPQTLVEAYAVGTPVIAPRHGAFPELVKEGETGFLFEPGNASDLVRCVRLAFSDWAALERMRAYARAEFEAKYTAEHNYQMLMTIYESALKETVLIKKHLKTKTNL